MGHVTGCGLGHSDCSYTHKARHVHSLCDSAGMPAAPDETGQSRDRRYLQIWSSFSPPPSRLCTTACPRGREATSAAVLVVQRVTSWP